MALCFAHLNANVPFGKHELNWTSWWACLHWPQPTQKHLLRFRWCHRRIKRNK